MLGYRVHDAYAWAFGVNQASQAYPYISFTNDTNHNGDPEEEVIKFRKLGLNRLKSALGDEYEYIIAGDGPTDDSIFGTITGNEPTDDPSSKLTIAIIAFCGGLALFISLFVSTPLQKNLKKKKTNQKNC